MHVAPLQKGRRRALLSEMPSLGLGARLLSAYIVFFHLLAAHSQNVVCQIATLVDSSLQSNLGISCNTTNTTRRLVESSERESTDSPPDFCDCTNTPPNYVWHRLSDNMLNDMSNRAKPGWWYFIDDGGECVLTPDGAVDVTRPVPCPPGFYCYGRLAPARSCGAGDHCPMYTGDGDRRCPSGFFCPSPGSLMQPCPDGTLCPPGTSSPLHCHVGSYCVQGVEKECPLGHYCPYGATHPRKCDFLSICSNGAGYENVMLKCVLLLAGFYSVAYVGYTNYDRIATNQVKFCLCFCGLAVAITMWFIDRPIATFASVLYIVVVGNWAMLQARDVIPKWLARLLLVVSLVTAELLLWLAHPQWSAFVAGLFYLCVVGFLMSRESRIANYIGTASLVVTFFGLLGAMWSNDRQASVWFISFIVGSICILLASWFLEPFLEERRQRRRIAFPPVPFVPHFPTRWESGVPPLPNTGSFHSGDGEDEEEGPCVRSNFTNLISGFRSRPPEGARLSQSAPAVPLTHHSAAEKPGSLPRIGSPPIDPLSMSMGSATPGTSDERVKGVSFHLKEVDFELLDGSALLSNISLYIGRGRRVAVMGPSGSGKSTLLAVLSGRASYGHVRGSLRVNGREAHDLHFLRHVIGFVPQDDVLHTELSVRENIEFQAALRNPSASLRHNVEEVLKDLGLTDLSESRVGNVERRGISGGQRKRVSIAMELVTQPLLLFADEPTSGLDSTTSHEVMKCFNEGAAHIGTTVIAVIHQPKFETLCLFDDLILLGPGGHLVYAESTEGAVDFFERQHKTLPPKTNPADVFLDIIQQTPSETLKQKWESFRPDILEDDAVDSPEQYKRPRPALIQATLLFTDRSLRQILRRYGALIINHLLIACTTIVAATVIVNDRLDNWLMQMAFAALGLMLVQGVAAQRTFGADLLVTWREAQVGVPMLPYFLGKDLATLVEITLAAAVFTASYGALARVQLSLVTLFRGSWAFVYALTGLNYIFSIIASPTAAQMSAVVAAFVSFCVGGVYEPPLPILTSWIGGRGWMIPALSPIRWFWGFLLTAETPFFTAVLRSGSHGSLKHKGYDDQYLDHCVGGVPPKEALRLPEAWATGQGWVCSVSEMLLLGLLFRFTAGVCLLLFTSAQSAGWAIFFGNSSSNVWKLVGKICTVLLGAFMAVFLFAEIWIMGETNMTVQWNKFFPRVVG